ncbi:endonuclease domain-containing protein [Chloroflexota bacterium]
MSNQNERPQRGEVLVAIMNNQRDFGILHDQLWYRIPVDKAPRRWPPKWLALYQTKKFGDEGWAVNYFGQVREINVTRRRDLLPEDPIDQKSDRDYYQVRLQSLERLPEPIFSRKFRRIVFLSSTWEKFVRAAGINDPFDDSPLEDRLWAQLRRLEMGAERQWRVEIGGSRYYLGFALFCEKGPLDLETDGDRWHASPECSDRDNVRDNDLKAEGWQVMRFTGRQIREGMTDYCLPKVTKVINSLGGLSDRGMMPRRLYRTGEGYAEQLRLFESPAEYDFD